MAELDPGTVVGSRYEILSHLGSGGMGAVYRVRDLQGDGDAALKVLNTAVDQGEVRQRFLREFSILSRIRHPRIVRPHQWGMYEGRPYFAMDYISGNSLDVWVKEGEKRAQLVDSHFFSLIHQIGEGLAHIHERGWVHRDLKPSNIMICEADGNFAVTILDFGLVRLRQPKDLSLTQPGMTIGTVEYMSPEQIKGKWVDQRSDLYSLGAIMYEILTGTPPFTGANPVSVILQHFRDLPRPLRTHRKGISAQLQQVVMKLLEKEPIDRYHSVEALLKSLQRVGIQDSRYRESTLPVSLPSTPMLYPQFVGRDGEMKVLRDLVKEVQNGMRRVVLISGEAGIGKSGMMEELQGDARVLGMQVLQGNCYEVNGRAYEPLIEAFSGEVHRHREGWDIGKLVDDEAGRGGALHLPGRQMQIKHSDPYPVMEMLAEFIKRLSREQPMLLCIEDIQWADELTVEFLNLLRRDREQTPILLCLTCRRVEGASLPERIEEFFHSIEMQGDAHLQLNNLTLTDVGHLAASMLGERNIPKEIAQDLFEKTGGNPFFVIALVRELIATGVVYREKEGKWVWQSVPKTLVPSGVAEIIRIRIKKLRLEQNKVLEYASVFRGAFSFGLISEIWRGDEFELLEILEDLGRLGLIQDLEDYEGRYRFCHVLFKQAIYQGLSEKKRELLHLTVGKSLENLYEKGEDERLDDLAYHVSRAGDAERMRRYLVKAGRKALDSFAFARAVELFQTAFEQGLFSDEVLIQSSQKRVEGLDFLCDYAKALIGCGRYEEAKAKIGKVTELASDDMLAQKARAWMLLGIIHGPQEVRTAETNLRDALAIYQQLGDERSELDTLVQLSSVYEVGGKVEDAIKCCRFAAEKCRNFGEPVYKVRAYSYLGYAALMENRLQEAQSCFESASGLQDQVEDQNYRHVSLHHLGWVYFCTGEFGRAEEIYQETYDVWHRRGAKAVQASVLLSLGRLVLETGEFDRAETYAREAEMLLSETGRDRLIYMAYVLLMEVAVASGDMDQALAWADRVRPGVGLSGNIHISIWAGIGKALSAAGRYDEAREAFEKAVGVRDRARGFARMRAYMQAGEFFLERGNQEFARSHVEVARAGFEEMGATYFEQRAVGLLERISEIDEDQPLTLVSDKLSQDRLRTLYEVSGDLITLLDLNPLLDRVLDRLLKISKAERAIVVLKDESAGEIRIQVARSHDIQDETAEEISRGIIREVVEQNNPILSLDARADERFGGYQSVIDYDIRSVLCVPLFHAEEGGTGALYVDCRGVTNVFSEEDRLFLSAFGNMVSIAIHNARVHTQVKNQTLHLQQQVEGRYQLGELIGQSEAMQKVYQLIEQAAGMDVTVLLRGETGTGKELATRAIHYNSARKDGPFLSQNCAALSPELLQSQLFGHQKGAFTGAVNDQEGLFEAAEGGTVFLDEIGDASPEVQSNLLRVLQEGEIRRIGENTARKVDVRVIAATNRDLEVDVEQGTFREDLYYRLRVLQIEMPSLRQISEDIPLLAEGLLKRVTEETGKSVKGFTIEAIQALMGYAWPGNVRELENEVRRVVAIVEEGGEISSDLFSAPISTGVEPGADLSQKGYLKAHVDAFEKQTIIRMLAECEGNITQAAARLGLTRYGLQKKMARLEIRRGSGSDM